MRYEGMSLVGSIVGLVFLILFYSCSYILVKNRYQNKKIRHLFFQGLTLKFVGALAFASVYQFYYQGGDTFRYFANTETLVNLFYKDPWTYFKFLSKFSLSYSEINKLDGVVNMLDSKSTYLPVRIASVVGLFTGNFYLVTTFFFALLSYIGNWALFRTSIRIFPAHQRYLAIAVLFIPSVFFWGSSIMKDSIVLGFLGLLVYVSYRFLLLKELRLKWLLLMMVCFYVLFNVKVYVILSFLPALFLWIVFANTNSIKNKRLRLLAKPFSFLFLAVAIGVGLPLASQYSDSYSIEAALQTAETTANYISRVSLQKGGAAYDLGEVSYTPLGMLKVFPQAVNVSLFRPYLWEVKNPVMFLAALEGTALLLITISLVYKVGFFSFMRTIFRNPFVLASFSFSILFAFAVGISTYNFGALVRYKIPCMSFYGIVLAVAYGEYQATKRIGSIRKS